LSTEPERVSAEDIFEENTGTEEKNRNWIRGLVFTGKKKEQRNLHKYTARQYTGCRNY
jgi:hypothetical protein